MKERTKVYLYTRVSTAMQIDGYSLEAQKNRMKAYAEFNDYEIAGEYEDAGKSGKSIEGRIEFSRMMTSNAARIMCLMCWCLSYPGSGAMRLMYFPRFR